MKGKSFDREKEPKIGWAVKSMGMGDCPKKRSKSFLQTRISFMFDIIYWDDFKYF